MTNATEKYEAPTTQADDIIGELTRNGKTIYYAFIGAVYVESYTRKHLANKLAQYTA